MKKAIPIFITILITLYLLVIFVFPFLGIVENINYVAYVIPITGIALIGALIYVLIERLREIDKEKDDDLSKY